MGLPDLLLFSGNDATLQPSFARFGDLTLSSTFQPIFCFSHHTPIGYEALLRAYDSFGNEVAPLKVLTRPVAPGRWNDLERSIQLLHASNFMQVANAQQQLFLYARPDSFITSDAYRRLVEDTLTRLQLMPERVVLEVLETPNGNLERLLEGIVSFRRQGFLIALDDFGAGHLNIDRVWRLQPDIVKLDRSVITQAAREPRVARMLSRLVSLLHETGALVLVEGVETQSEALLSMECDADFVQGFYFARPAPGKVDEESCRAVMDSISEMYRARVELNERTKTTLLSAYTDALQTAADRLCAGIDLPHATEDLLRVEGAARCFLLDGQGYQIGDDLKATQPRASAPNRFRSTTVASGGCWDRRPYFRDAISEPGTVQISEPYLSINGMHLCITFSIAISARGSMWVLCADTDWQHMAGRYDVGNAMSCNR
ncbi:MULTISPECIES: EAL domain-containing protein [Paraburkholderia]|uniref:EAL domain-containing protein n=1 Tax=Paraburkholderia madseniana TaxID=2599607 RepID=A0AAP5BKP7_9BURK|nr:MULTISPECIES: EAL domain-containing protein [Paraburkholderia]MCX4149946.1 EAL domain-containing protein [Paraburkholderia madseniana]MDN7152882.1 EAL domain-containing protein [Paraburkholderia sp. WS6]MDQ6411764.1 EAL domain-containing protein [Paraburkholderia madseniana]